MVRAADASLVIQRACLTADRDRLVSMLTAHVNRAYDARRFDWAYRDNPAGEARAWMAYDQKHGALVGAAAAFPREAYLGSDRVTGWVLGDFCIAEGYRVLGPAVQLQRACLASVASASTQFWYDFPNLAMVGVYARLGIKPSGRMLRLALPLRLEPHLTRRRGRRLTLPIAVGVDLIRDLARAIPSGTARFDIGTHSGYCGDEFSRLAEEVAGRYGPCIVRSAGYLNWRYLRNPFCRYELLTARADGRLRGYAVLAQSQRIVRIDDIFGASPSTVIPDLLAHAIRIFARRGMHGLSITVIDSHPWLPLLRRAGFLPRERSPLVVYPVTISTPESGTQWLLGQGDGDG